jgi:5-hydroxyisourate hydrolase-like protein (transthyretin family)
LRFAIAEYSGVALSSSLDGISSATATTSSPNSGNVTTTANGDLLLGAVATADSVTFTPASGYTARDFVPAPPGTKLITEDQIQAAAGLASAGATLSASSSWGAILVAAKAPGGVAGSPASIAATAGTPQSATVNTAFGAQLQATVKDSFNNPVSGATVTFAAPASGDSGAFAGGVTTATTNAQGVATAAVFTANATAGGPYTVTASVSGVAAPANFSLTNLAGPAASITATAGTPQSASITKAFTTQLQATVKDSVNNPVSGVTVTFTAPASGASGAFAGGVNTAITNAQGMATAAVFTANATAGGPYNVAASVAGVATPANFSLTNLAGPAATITTTAGTPQSATINTAFATQLQATVTDSGNNPVSGVNVTFTAPASGASGTFAGGVKTATTNAQGVATAPVFTANTTAGGPYNVAASVSGVATPANFSLTNLAGAAATITATAGTPQSASINTAFATQFQATVKDSGNNPVSGVTVTFTAPASGASGTFAGGVNTATTNAQGIATAPVFTANATAGGPYIVTASATGVATSANFSLTNLGNPPASITATAGTPQSATINTAFAAQLQVTVKDSGNNPVNGVAVTFIAPASGPSGTFAGGVNTATTNAQGIATSTVFTANSAAGGPYTVTASVTGVATPASFSLTNLVGPPATVAASAGTPQSATINTAFVTQFQALVTDAGNNPLNGVTVTFTAPVSGASGTFAGGTNTAITNAQGLATAVIFTANTTAGGPYIVTPSVSGVATPANFSLTNLAGAPASIAATAGTPQSANINTAFTTPLRATVTDSFNNPVNGATVTFSAPASGASGTFAGGVNTATTNAQGVAAAPVFTANGTAGGPYTVAASVSGVATPANFSLTNVASAPANIQLVQHAGMDAGTTTSATLAFPAANTAGNWIAVSIRGGLSSSQVFTLKDSLGNTYKQAAQIGFTASSVTMAIFYAENIKSGANTVTVTMTVSGPLRFAVSEYSGVVTANSLD